MANLQAFENLKETAQESLSEAEKGALNKINESDFRSAKENIGKKEFNVDGRNMSIKDIVKNLTFSSDGKVAYLNGKPIAKKSELGAALQVYAIANNRSIGGTKIDGWLGKNSNQGLMNVQQDMGIDGNGGNSPKASAERTEKMSIGELLSKSFKGYFDAGELQDLYNKRVMNPNTYTLTPTNRSTYAADKKLNFSYQYEGKNLQIVIPIPEDSRGEVDPKQLADIIRDKINEARDNRTTEVDNSSADKGIDSFNERNIKNPVVKRWAEIKGVNFTSEVLSGGKIRVRAKSGKNVLRTFDCKNDDVLTNRHFDVNKFDNIIKRECYNSAVAEVRSEIQNTKTAIDGARITRSSDANGAVRRYEDLITKIRSYNSRELDAEKSSVEEAKRLAEIKERCFKRLEDMNADIRTLNSMSKTLTKANKEKVISVLGKHSQLNKVGSGKYEYRYTMQPKAGRAQEFSKAGLSKKFDDGLKTLKNIADTYEIEIN